MLRDLVYVSLCDGGTQVLVITWHNHLQQVFILEHIVFIRVKVLHYIVSIGFRCLFHPVIA